MNTEKVIKTTHQRMINIDKALQREGANPQEIHQSMLFGIIALLRNTYGDSLSNANIHQIVDDVLETIALEEANADITEH